MTSLDRNDVCRVCLSKNENDDSFHNMVCDETSWRKLYACTSVKVRPDDSMSKILCSTCVNRIDDAYSLRRRAQSSDATLRKKYDAAKIEYADTEYEEIDFKNNNVSKNDYDREDPAVKTDEECMESHQSENLAKSKNKTKTKPNYVMKKLKIRNKRAKKKNVKIASEKLTKPNDADFTDESEKYDQIKLSYKCEKCACIFNQRNFYIKHMKTVHNLNSFGRVKKYMCDICGNIFHDKYGLIMHMRCHSGDRPFTCTICGQGFSQSINMKRHISAKHHKVKSYQCELCPKRFAYLSTLREHAKNHSGELLHACDVCDRRFSRRFSLVRHQLTHTRARPFTCVHCSRGYTQTNDLKSHVKRSHPGAATEKLSDYCIKELKK